MSFKFLLEIPPPRAGTQEQCEINCSIPYPDSSIFPRGAWEALSKWKSSCIVCSLIAAVNLLILTVTARFLLGPCPSNLFPLPPPIRSYRAKEINPLSRLLDIPRSSERWKDCSRVSYFSCQSLCLLVLWSAVWSCARTRHKTRQWEKIKESCFDSNPFPQRAN